MVRLLGSVLLFFVFFQSSTGSVIDDQYRSNGRMLYCKIGIISNITNLKQLHGPFSRMPTNQFPRIGGCTMTFDFPANGTVCNATSIRFGYLRNPAKEKKTLSCRYSFCTSTIDNISMVLMKRFAPLPGKKFSTNDEYYCLRNKLFESYLPEKADLDLNSIYAKEEPMDEEYQAMVRGYYKEKSQALQKLRDLTSAKEIETKMNPAMHSFIMVASSFFFVAIIIFIVLVVLDTVIRRTM